MPRRLKVETRELGMVEMFLIYAPGGEWEAEWKPLQGTDVGDLFTVVTKEVMDHALWGYSKPLVEALGLPPKGALHKMPHPLCANRIGCTFYEARDCVPTGRNLPHCYQPEGLPSEESRQLAFEAVRLWRDGVYIAVVKEPTHA
jgi:hypothetical protein